MTTPDAVAAAPDSTEALRPPPASRDEVWPRNSFEEINERRARVENTELLRHLRGL
jgi:hypothetical protein